MPLHLESNNTRVDLALALTRDRANLHARPDLVRTLTANLLDADKPAKILFLADGRSAYEDGKPTTVPNLFDEYGTEFGPKLSGVVMHSTDFGFTDEKATLTASEASLKLDNTTTIHKTLTPGGYDLVLGRALICWCHSYGACGLPVSDTGVGAKFLRRVWKLLNPQNKLAAAYLHGVEGAKRAQTFDFWRAAAVLATKGGTGSGVLDPKTLEPTPGVSMKAQNTKGQNYADDMAVHFLKDAHDNLVCLRVSRVGTGWTINTAT